MFLYVYVAAAPDGIGCGRTVRRLGRRRAAGQGDVLRRTADAVRRFRPHQRRAEMRDLAIRNNRINSMIKAAAAFLHAAAFVLTRL